MRTRIAILAGVIATLAPWAAVEACSCFQPSLAGLYKDSARVILGEVEKVEVQTTDPVDGQEVTFVATVRPIETYKGPGNVDIRITFTGRYSDPKRPVPPPGPDGELAERTWTLVGGCPEGMAEGSRYVIFQKQDEQLHYAGWCDGRIQYWERIVLDYMRGLSGTG